MARYMETAGKANAVALEILAMVATDQQPILAAALARLFNLGVRVSPRVVQHTVRLNAVQRAMQNLPVRCRMTTVPKTYGGGTFNALSITPIMEGATAIVEGSEDADE